jgi:hypothetical protein
MAEQLLIFQGLRSMEFVWSDSLSWLFPTYSLSSWDVLYSEPNIEKSLLFSICYGMDRQAAVKELPMLWSGCSVDLSQK